MAAQEARIMGVPDTTPVTYTGFLGPLWTILHLRAARRLAEANAKEIKAETDRQVTVAREKIKAITARCKEDVHEVHKWTNGTHWTTKNTITNVVMEEYHYIHGRCIHCGSPVTKRAYIKTRD